jgi:hypothetical protein
MKHNQPIRAKPLLAKISRKKWLILLPLCIVGIVAVVLQHPGTESMSVQGNRVVDFVKGQYQLLSEGKYQQLSQNVVEGLWRGESRKYVLSGVMQQGDFAKQLEDDLGVGGWRLHFVTLQAVGYSVVARKTFGALLARENQILDEVDPSKSIQKVFVVKMSGHNTGRCSIVEWERLVPVIQRNGTYLILMRGAPEVYSLVHNEQWFQPIRF